MASAVYRLRTAPPRSALGPPRHQRGPTSFAGHISLHCLAFSALGTRQFSSCVLILFEKLLCVASNSSHHTQPFFAPPFANPPHTCRLSLPAHPACPTRKPRTDQSAEERESLGKSLFTDYLSSPDLEEAVGTAQELEAPGFMPKLVQVWTGRERAAGREGWL